MDETFTFQIWNEISQRCGTDQRQKVINPIGSNPAPIWATTPATVSQDGWLRIKNRNKTKQGQNSSKEETSLIDTSLCWLDVGRMCCHSGINGLRRLLLHCVVVNGIVSYSPTSEPLSLDCSLVLWIIDYDCSLPSPLSHLLIKWLQLRGCSVFITRKLAKAEIRLMSGTCSFLFSLFFSSFSMGSRATKQRK